MPFLSLNGISIPVAADSAQREPVDIGDRGRAHDGTPFINRRGVKEEWSFSSTLKSQTEANALRKLITGIGDHWTFDSDFYSDKGNYPTLTTGSSIDSGTGKHTFGALRTTNDFTVVLDSAARYGKLTCAYWAVNAANSAWEHWLLTSSGSTVTYYKNGVLHGVGSSMVGTSSTLVVPNSTTAAWNIQSVFRSVAPTRPQWAATTAYTTSSYVRTLASDNGLYYQATVAGTSGGTEPTWPTTLGNTVVDGTVTWTCRGTYNAYVDEFWALPFEIPSSWIAEIYTEMNTRALNTYPKLRAAGDALGVIGTGNLTVVGAAGPSTIVGSKLSGSWAATGEVFDFTLQES
jgi:hypothetical protein